MGTMDPNQPAPPTSSKLETESHPQSPDPPTRHFSAPIIRAKCNAKHSFETPIQTVQRLLQYNPPNHYDLQDLKARLDLQEKRDTELLKEKEEKVRQAKYEVYRKRQA